MRHGSSLETNRCGFRTFAVAAIGFLAAVSLTPVVIATPLQIASYDVAEAPLSGFGCWSHTFSGTITLTGRTVIGCGNDPPVPVANYTGGSGSLNDGVIATSEIGSQLFTLTSYDGGPPLNPTITLHLDPPGVVNRVQIYGGPSNNVIPGGIDGVTVEIGGISVPFATTPFGPLNPFGVPVNDEIDLSGSLLAGVVTDRIVLRDFTASFAFDSLISITEITVHSDGVPEPAALPLLVLGLAGLGLAHQRKHTVSSLFAQADRSPAALVRRPLAAG